MTLRSYNVLLCGQSTRAQSFQKLAQCMRSNFLNSQSGFRDKCISSRPKEKKQFN